MKLKDHPGPFVISPPTASYPKERSRPAAWVNCAVCGQLVAKAYYLMDPKKSGVYICGAACDSTLRIARYAKARANKAPSHLCAHCGKLFNPSSHPGRPGPRLCSPQCTTAYRSRSHSFYFARTKLIYLNSRGIEESNMTCEYCGTYTRVRAQQIIRHRRRPDLRPGNLEAVCDRCSGKKTRGEALTKTPTEVARW